MAVGEKAWTCLLPTTDGIPQEDQDAGTSRHLDPEKITISRSLRRTKSIIQKQNLIAGPQAKRGESRKYV